MIHKKAGKGCTPGVIHVIFFAQKMGDSGGSRLKLKLIGYERKNYVKREHTNSGIPLSKGNPVVSSIEFH